MIRMLHNFDVFDSLADLNKAGFAYGVFQGLLTLDPTAGVDGSPCVVAGDGSEMRSFFEFSCPSQATVGLKASLKFSGTSAANRRLLELRDGANLHIGIGATPSRQLYLTRGTTVLATSSESVPAGVFFDLEVKATIDDTVGSVEIRLNGSDTAFVSYNGDTRNGGTAVVNLIRGGHWSSSNQPTAWTGWDDLIQWDTVGPDVTDWVGRAGVLWLPVTGDGAVLQWTPSAGTEHYALLDEASSNEDTDYLATTAPGQRDELTFAAVPATVGEILAVMPYVDAKRLGSGGAAVKLGFQLAGTDYPGPEQSVSPAWGYVGPIVHTSPASGVKFTKEELNGALLLIESA